MSDAPPPPPAARRDLMESPVEIDGQALIGGRPLLWTATAIACATLFLLLTNAVSLDGWAAELPPSEQVARLNDVTGRWRETTDATKIGAPRAAMHAAWKHFEAARFAGQAPAEP